MNFPHKSLTPIPGAAEKLDVAATSEHHALIARAIARQSLSYSARTYVAYLSGDCVAVKGNRQSGLEDRIQFFAGKATNSASTEKSGRRFARGHFRPDLVGEEQPRETA